jgi:hypothetical protein
MSCTLRLCWIALLATCSALAQEVSLPQDASVSDVHKAIVTPASDTLFKAESSRPKSEKQWSELERNTAALAKSATRLMSKDLAKNRKKWIMFAGALRNEANSAMHAAKLKDMNELIAANGRIVAICESCHDDYRDNGHGMTSDKTQPTH